MILKEYIKSFLKNRKYMLFLILTMVFAYGCYFTYDSIHIDDTAMGRYYVDGWMLRQGRWGIYVLTNLFHMTEYRPFIHKFCTMGSLFFACLLLCSILKRASGNKIKDNLLTAFSCLFVTYSMINEILFYVGSQWSSTIDYVFTAGAVWLLLKEEKRIWDWILAVLSLSFGISLYEVSASVYIVLVVIVLLIKNHYQEEELRSIKDSVRQGLPLAGVLVCAVIWQTLIAYMFLAVSGLSSTLRIGDSLWISGNPINVLKTFISQMVTVYGIHAIFYLPVAELLAAGICNLIFFIHALWKRKWNRAFLWMILGIGSLSMSLIAGAPAYYRAGQQVFSIYTAFLFCVILFLISENKRSRWINLAYLGIAYLIICQCVDLNKWEYVNYLIDQEEQRVAVTIGNKLEQEYDLTKPVVFVGKYRFSNNIRKYTHVKEGSSKDLLAKKMMNQVPFPVGYRDVYIDDYGYKYVELHNSILAWGVSAFGEVNTEILNYFGMLGYELKQGTLEMYQEGVNLAWDMPAYPQLGYIRDCGDYILVNFGE
ncbi:MAG: hypothetical protein HFH41_06685 [Lachnospiraceae bacterium]|nr:hypothetical protein [Lachnospiraceae bacterium]